MTDDLVPKMSRSWTTLAIFCLVCLALAATAAWVMAAQNWHARSLALAALVVLGVASVYLLSPAPKRQFKGWET